MTRQPDLKRLRLTTLDLRSSGRRSRAQRPTRAHGLFLKGPIPWPWLSAAARLPGRALHVAVAIRLFVGMKKTSRIALSVSWLAELGLSRHAAYRGLIALESRGLVSVDRHRGRKPVVTVIEIGSNGAAVSSTTQSSQESKDV